MVPACVRCLPPVQSGGMMGAGPHGTVRAAWLFPWGYGQVSAQRMLEGCGLANTLESIYTHFSLWLINRVDILKSCFLPSINSFSIWFLITQSLCLAFWVVVFHTDIM